MGLPPEKRCFEGSPPLKRTDFYSDLPSGSNNQIMEIPVDHYCNDPRGFFAYWAVRLLTRAFISCLDVTLWARWRTSVRFSAGRAEKYSMASGFWARAKPKPRGSSCLFMAVPPVKGRSGRPQGCRFPHCPGQDLCR